MKVLKNQWIVDLFKPSEIKDAEGVRSMILALS